MRYALGLVGAFLTAVSLCLLATDSPGQAPAQSPAQALFVNPKVLAFLKPVQPAEGDSDLKKKLKERHNSAVTLLDERIKEYRKGIRDISFVYEAARLAAEAKRDLAEGAKARAVALEQTLELAKLFEAYLQQQLTKGFGSKGDLERARYGRLTLEVELLKGKKAPEKNP
jgi:hypothetical protein